MTLPRARVLRAGAASDAPVALLVRPPQRVLAGAVADAAIEARRRLELAARCAQDMVAAAEGEAKAIRQRARAEARAAAEADLAAAWIRLRSEDARSDERSMDRTIEIAAAMAERLLGEALAIDPLRVAAIARQALTSARSARRVIIRAHPVDAEALSAQLAALDLEGASVQIHADESRTRGSLYFETDLGSLDAQLTLQLDRLTHSLRESGRR